jgi:hypothetical protein
MKLALSQGKIGYGTVSEALAYKIPFVFVRRDYFNEEPFLRNMLEVKPGFMCYFHTLSYMSLPSHCTGNRCLLFLLHYVCPNATILC